MKRNSFSAILALGCLVLIISCTKHDAPVPPKPPTKKAVQSQWATEGSLLKVRAYIESPVPATPNDSWRWTTYEYDKNFNLVSAVDSMQELTKEGYIVDGSPAKKVQEQLYSYNNNKLVKIEFVNVQAPNLTVINYNAQDQPVTATNQFSKYSFDYSDNRDTVTVTDVFNNGTTAGSTIMKYLFRQGYLVKLQQFELNNGSLNQRYSFDYNGYDQKNTPLKAVPQTDMARLFINSTPESWKNNLLSSNYTNAVNGNQVSRVYNYDYNTAGYPIRSSYTDNAAGTIQPGFTTYYFYANP